MLLKKGRGACMTDCRKKSGNGSRKNFASELLALNSMHAGLRIVGLVLLTATAVALPGAQTMLSAAAPASHPAGCHSHGPVQNGPAIPSPAPVSYQCCVSGHQAALPNMAFSLRSNVAMHCNLNDGASLGSHVAPNALLAIFVAPSDSPPVTGSLRI